MFVKNVHYALWSFCFIIFLILIAAMICLCRIRKSKSGSKVTGAFLYNLLFLQMIWMFGAIGSMSGNEYPWQPSLQDGWEPGDRLFIMFLAIVEFITVIFNLIPYYQTFKIIKEGNPDTIVPCTSTIPIVRFIKNILFCLMFFTYLGGAGWASAKFMQEKISSDEYFEIMSWANIVGSLIGPILVIFYTILFCGIGNLNGKFKTSFFMILIVNFVWTAARLARGIQGLSNPDLLHDLVSEQSTSTLVERSIIYFVTTIMPYISLVTPLIYSSFFLYKSKNENKHDALLPYNQGDTNDSSSPLAGQIPNQFQ
ncbi:unnamed protein product [Moneuplotes crassus]|uniref:Transmembrane protein n=2 Tax=Euplotes crassus TaxID=5936 RepID=A0AAD2CZT3_EUPCR|nr:unnamed protein product [Moneuplotes crassus]